MMQEFDSYPKLKSVFHFAGLSTLQQADQNKDIAFEVNTKGALETARQFWKLNPSSRFFFASTAQVYAPMEDVNEVILSEDSPVLPQSVYAESKLQAEQELAKLSHEVGAPLTILRFFNHTHKLQPNLAFLPYIYDCIAKRNLTEVPVGNIEVYRDIGSIWDLVSAMRLLVNRNSNQQIEVFNVCTGKARKLSELAHGLATKLDLPLELVVDPARIRKNDTKLIQGNCGKLCQATGWKPLAETFDQFMDDFLRDI